ncbi:MAG: hypothetical protein ACHP6H_03520, partial [Legionellales bacterium]
MREKGSFWSNILRRATSLPALGSSGEDPSKKRAGSINSSSINTSAESSRLIAQVGTYDGALFPEGARDERSQAQFVDDRLGAQGVRNLHAGIEVYQQQHKLDVSDYKKRNLGACVGVTDESRFFRAQFVDYIVKLNAERDQQAYYKYVNAGIQPATAEGFAKYRKEHPDDASASLEELLGKEGVVLYNLALEEEVNSKEFMNALFCKSTQKIEGATWLQRPVIFVAGVSASGKSFAVGLIFKMANRFISKGSSSEQGNYAVAVEG